MGVSLLRGVRPGGRCDSSKGRFLDTLFSGLPSKARKRYWCSVSSVRLTLIGLAVSDSKGVT